MKKEVVKIRWNKSVRYAGQILKAVDIGCIIVVDEKDNLAGILTERDIVQKVVAKGLDPDKTMVKDIMSRDVITVDKQKSIEDAVRIMDQKKIKKLPVIDNGKLIGIVTMTDLLRELEKS
jgi:CBS domain-containing protein